MIHPITYWTQTPAIDQLVAKYGDYLEKLDTGSKAGLLDRIAIQLSAEFDNDADSGHDAYRLIQDESPDTLLGLIEAIAVQLRHQLHEQARSDEIPS
jgi:hypothetical protein